MIPSLKNDQSLQELIPQGLLDQKYEQVLFIRKSTVNDKDEIVLASEYSIYFFISKTFSKQLQLKLSFTWDQIKSINVPDATTFILTNNEKEFKIIHKDAVQMFYSILLHLKSIFIPSEMPQVEIKVNQPSGITPNPSPMMSRYINLARKYNIEIATNVLNALKECSSLVRKCEEKHKPVELDLGFFPNLQNQMYIYLKTAEIEPSIQKLIFPKTGKAKPWTSLIPYFQNNDTIDGIICKELISEDFKEIVESISKNSKSKITSVTFQDTSFTEDSLVSITNLMKIKNIDSISILSSIDASQFEKLAPNFTDLSTKLSSLNISRCSGVDPSIIIKYLPNLKRLDISNNSVDVSNTLFALAENQHHHLQELIANGNYCTKELTKELKIPKHLEELQLRRVTWAKYNLLMIIKLLCKKRRSNHPCSLHLSRAEVDNDSWKTIFKKMSRIEVKNLVEFYWDANPINESIFKMLLTAKSLQTLSFGGCFDENDENLNDFIEFLPNCYNLKKLVVSGSESKKMKQSIQLIFDVLEHLDINILDVSKNAIGDQLFVMLSHLIISNPNVTEFFIDGNLIQTIPAYETFLDQMIQRHSKLVIDMPKQDLLKLSSKNKAVKKTRFSGIVQKFYELTRFPMPIMKSVLRRPDIDQIPPVDGPKTVKSPIILPKISTIEENTATFNSLRPIQTKVNIPVSEIPAPPEKPSEIEYLHHEIQSDDSYEYFYSEDEDPEDGRYDFDRIGKANWDDAEKVFIDDEFWLKSQEQPLILNTRQTIDAFYKDFTIQNLFSQMR